MVYGYDYGMLVSSGFAVIRHPTERYKSTRFYPRERSEVFKMVRMYGFPVFVTCDSLLHLFHSTLDNTLKILEHEVLFGSILKMTRILLSELGAILNNVTNGLRSWLDSPYLFCSSNETLGPRRMED